MIVINKHNIREYLLQRGVISKEKSLIVHPLSGGVSSTLLKLIINGRCFVLKQPLAKLKVSVEWSAPLWRSHVEAKCIRFLSTILPRGAVPKIILEDPVNHVIIMSCVSGGAVLWRDALMKGKVDPKVAEKAGFYLAIIQNKTFNDSSIKEQFCGYPLGKIDAYYKAIKPVHPDLKEQIEDVTNFSMNNRNVLMLSDFNPKNIFVKNNRITLIDLEGAHWGDQSFDPALLMTHLLLKSIFNCHIKKRYFEAVHAFWRAYRGSLRSSIKDLEAKVVMHIGALMLARVNGKSPVKYLNERGRATARSLGREILFKRYSTVQTVINRLNENISG